MMSTVWTVADDQICPPGVGFTALRADWPAQASGEGEGIGYEVGYEARGEAGDDRNQKGRGHSPTLYAKEHDRSRGLGACKSIVMCAESRVRALSGGPVGKLLGGECNPA